MILLNHSLTSLILGKIKIVYLSHYIQIITFKIFMIGNIDTMTVVHRGGVQLIKQVAPGYLLLPNINDKVLKCYLAAYQYNRYIFVRYPIIYYKLLYNILYHFV